MTFLHILANYLLRVGSGKIAGTCLIWHETHTLLFQIKVLGLRPFIKISVFAVQLTLRKIRTVRSENIFILMIFALKILGQGILT